MANNNDPNLVWKIAGGIVLGVLMLSLLQSCRQRVAVANAMEQFNATMEPMRRENQQRAKAQQQREQSAREAATLKPGERCISGQRLRRLPNGWEQIGTC